MATPITYSYTDTSNSDSFSTQTGSLANLGSTSLLPNNFSQLNVSNGLKPFGYVPAGATNLNITILEHVNDADMQIFTKSGQHIYGTPLSDQTWTYNGINGSTINTQVINTNFGFDASATYDSSPLVDASSATDGSTHTVNSMNINVIYHDQNTNSQYEEIQISSVTEDLIVLFNVICHVDIVNISYTPPTTSYGITGGTSNAGWSELTNTYGTLKVNEKTGDYSFIPDAKGIEILLSGQSVSDIFDVFKTTNGVTDYNQININITGTDDLTICNGLGNYGIVKENTITSTPTSLLNFTDPDGYVIDASTNTTGIYGTLNLFDNGDGTWSWSYNLDMSSSSVLDLNKGDIRYDNFSVITTDGVECQVSVEVNGYNQIVLSPETIAYTDTVNDDTFNATIGTLVVSDAAVGKTVTFDIKDKNATYNGNQVQIQGKYGILVLDRLTGSYQYTPNDTAIESLISNSYETFNLYASDGLTESYSTFRVNITAANDTPTIGNVILDYTDTQLDDYFAIAKGSITYNDPDQTTNLSITGGNSSGSLVTKVGKYGTLAINKKTLAYSYTPNDRAMESLKVNDTDVFTITAGTSTGSFTVNINASDDLIDVQASATAIPEGISNIGGKLKLSDRDDTTPKDIQAQTKTSTTYGFFSVDKFGNYRYEVNPANCLGYLSKGDLLLDTISFLTTDGRVGSLTINIIGNDGLATLGNDTLNGTTCNEQLAGLNGNDVLDGKDGDDTLIGGDGDDTYLVNSFSDQVIETNSRTSGNLDNIQLSIANPASTVYVIPTNVEYLKITSNVAQDVDGNFLSNQITGNAQANVLRGLLGNDTLIGGAGNDNLEGGYGNDVLRGETGNDTMIGGVGDDQYFANLVYTASTDTIALEDSVIELADEGTDNLTIGYISPNKLYHNYDVVLPDYIENFTLLVSGTTSTTNYVLFHGNDLNNQITGDGSANSLSGEDGDDSLYGGAGMDSLTGGDGKDLLSGQQGQDLLYGEDDNDQLYGGSENDTLYGGDGNDLLMGDSGNDDLDTGDGDNTADGGDGNDIIYASTGNDSLLSNAGNDLIFAGDGNDTIDGGNGSDIIQAGNGDDTIYVGSGREMVFGGAGDDQFIFNQTPITLASKFKTDSNQFALDFTNKTLYEYSVLKSQDYKYYDIGTLTISGVNYDLFYSQVAGGLYYEYSKIKPFKSYLSNAVITDFTQGQDSLTFDTSIFTGLTDLNTQFSSGNLSSATSSLTRLIYNKNTGDLFYDADGSGKGVAYHIVTLQGQPNLTSSDINLL